MTKYGIFALIAIAGATLLINEVERWWTRRRNSKRLIKIIMAGDSEAEQKRRSMLYQDDTEDSWYLP